MALAQAWWPLAVMAVDWAAVGFGWKRLEYAAKPAAMVALLVWLWWPGATHAWVPLPALTWFAAGLVCSLAGDVLLMLPERFFLGGLVTFLLGHVAYVVGLNTGGLVLPIEVLLLVPVGLAGGWLAWRVGEALRAAGREGLRRPVAIYAAVISVMVVSALATLFRPDWSGGPAELAAIGAVLFFASDAMLAWDRFVTPVPYGKLVVIVAYHLGQMAIIAGAAGALYGIP